MRIDLFCKVVDNFGDVGVCWRLARQLVSEAGANVRLWIDDLACLHRLWPSIAPDVTRQSCAGVEIHRWPDAFPSVAPRDVVIEAFGCALPASFVAAMAAKPVAPVWINLEYLSAEAWIEGCHTLPSPHRRLPLTKYFFFPGFTSRTGGLPREANLSARRDAFLADPSAAPAFLRRLGIDRTPYRAPPLVVSLFCYDNPALPELADAWAAGAQDVVCLVPAGSRPSVLATLDVSTEAGARSQQGRLRTRVVPFLDQDEYDRLLWSCDLNFVRGEDSFLRAQWAARPFVWQAYPQNDDAHRPKLAAFLDRYLADLDVPTAALARALFTAWNGGGNLHQAWPPFVAALGSLDAHAVEWDRRLAAENGLAMRLASFCHSKLK